MRLSEAIEQLKYYQSKPYVPTVKKVCNIALETIEALQQENERLADETIKLMKENAKNSNKKDELVKVLKQARDAINGYSTCPYCWGVNGHAKGCKFYEALQNIDALIGGKEDVTSMGD